MAHDNPQKELLNELSSVCRRFSADGDLGPILDAARWEELLGSRSAEERDLLLELASFTEVWHYLRKKGKKLGAEIVNDISRVHQLPIHERIVRLRQINQKLMERVGDAGEGAQFRQ
jgi:hypothetical protein